MIVYKSKGKITNFSNQYMFDLCSKPICTNNFYELFDNQFAFTNSTIIGLQYININNSKDEASILIVEPVIKSTQSTLKYNIFIVYLTKIFINNEIKVK